MTGGSLRGTPRDDIEATPSGISRNIVRVTSSGAPEDTVETPLGIVSPIHQSFDDGEDWTRVRTVVTGKEIVDADLKRPLKLYDRTTNPEDHLSRFSSVANSGEWPMPVWCRMFQQTLDGSARGWFKNLSGEITKIVRKENETLVAFKERWIVETGFITGIPEVMKISSFMDAHKCLELAKRHYDKVPKTVDEMMTRLDDFVRSEEAFASTELPKGEASESFKTDS
ncbi:hypothetical protein Tco_1292991 [Tanacetum coccineum]